MFKKPTLFIIGAGASCELDFPAGDKLKEIIADKLNFDTAEFHGNFVRGDTLIGETLRELDRLSAKNDGPRNHVRMGKFISGALPHGPSIDNFLHFHSSTPEIVKAGKIAIARTILEQEANSRIRFDVGHDTVDLGRATKTWLNRFCMMAIEGHTREQLEHIFDNVRIITFNYDRCIEHYVSHHLERYVGMERKEAQQIAKTLKVVHVYGRPGALRWETNRNDGVAFGEAMTPQQLIAAAEKIKTFTEGVHEDAGQEAITELMNWAKHFIIMGFSYGDINMDILLADIVARNCTIIAGMAGISPENQDVHKKRLLKGFGGAGLNASSITTPTTYAAQLLADHESFLKS